jgi:hypothetical protein
MIGQNISYKQNLCCCNDWQNRKIPRNISATLLSYYQAKNDNKVRSLTKFRISTK